MSKHQPPALFIKNRFLDFFFGYDCHRLPFFVILWSTMKKTVTFSVKFLVTSNIDVKSECLRTFVLMSFCFFFLRRFKPLWYCRMVQLKGSSTWHHCEWFLSSCFLTSWTLLSLKFSTLCSCIWPCVDLIF